MKIRIPGIKRSHAESANPSDTVAVKAVIEVQAFRSEDSNYHELDLLPKDLVELEFEEGVIWVATPNDLPTILQAEGTDRSVNEQDPVFTFPNQINYNDGHRDGLTSIALAFVRILAPKITTPLVKKAVTSYEKALLPFEGLNYLNDQFKLEAVADTLPKHLDSKAPVLLFLHGTISNTEGSFGHLRNSKTWEALCKKYGSNKLAFDHKTLSKSPFENAKELLEILPKNVSLHIVSHSRGGLVGEVLTRCSTLTIPFSENEINLLKKEGHSLLEKFLDVLKTLPKEALTAILEETGLPNFTKEIAKNPDQINWKTVALLMVKMEQIDWKDTFDLSEFFENSYESILSEILGQLNTPNRLKEVETLEAINQLAKEKQIKITKFVRVACPANGTSILGKRADHFFNVLLNLIGLAFGGAVNPFYQTVKALITTAIQERKNPTVLPGLEAMVPDSPLLALLNNPHRPINSDLNIIAGNLGGGQLLKPLRFLLKKVFFPEDTDMVVDTASMFQGLRRANPIYYKYVTGGDVHHLSYFKNKKTQTAIYHALTTPSQKQPHQFKEVIPDTRNRNIKMPKFEGGSVKNPNKGPKDKIIVLLPGIMGSNLSEVKGSSSKEIWIQYLRMAKGKLKDLNIENKKIKATSLIGTSYGKFATFLSNAYQVELFHYDWRMSLSASAKILRKTLEKLQKQNKPIQLIGHSMGGLVIRNLMMEHPKFWLELTQIKNFRCILLGTPWKGSYGIPKVITGNGETINSLAKLAIFESKKELLTIFVKFKGLLELLPIEPKSIHQFDQDTFWQALKDLTIDDNWVVPSTKDIQHFKKYRAKVKAFYESDFLKSEAFTKHVYYLAGRAEETPVDLVFQDQYLQEYPTIEQAKQALQSPFSWKQLSLVFKVTEVGDGSVAWADGIPATIDKHIYFADQTIHGALANDPTLFEGIQEILTFGSTTKIKQIRPGNRSDVTVLSSPSPYILSNQPDDLLRGVLSLKSNKTYMERTQNNQPVLNVSVKNGHLKYSSHPIIIGHFKNDIITSAENVMDQLLGNQLSQRADLGVYPGNIGTNLIVLPNEESDLGTIIIGLGEPETLTPYLLQQTVELSCLNYLLALEHAESTYLQESIGISSLLVGTQYVNISITETLNAILDGVVKANQKISLFKKDFPIITHLEIIELYQDKAIQALHHLYNIEQQNNYYNIRLTDKKINQANGARTHHPVQEGATWWRRVTALAKTNPVTHRKSLYFNVSSQQARVVERDLFTNQQIIAALLEENSKTHNWDKSLMKTVFNLIVPNDFKLIFRNQQNLLLILDKYTAWYPWELLHYDDAAKKPLCVSSGMIRQLSTSTERKVVKPVKSNTALVIGDPALGKNAKAPQLPGAEEEARIVSELLTNSEFETTTKIKANLSDIMRQLYGDYKIIHVASHGVVNFKVNEEDEQEAAKTGLLLANNIVLTPAEINNMDTTPELVFINSCYAGQIKESEEAYSRSRFNLAANIGTQFIENGVKAVIVAGWAIDDHAAHEFAKTFYEEMLKGTTFAQAILLARTNCFDKYGHRSNTWGAYQCYGDQNYRLIKKKGSNNQGRNYMDQRQIMADLENLINAAQSSRKRSESDDLKEALNTISQGVEKAKLGNAITLEMEAAAYAEIGAYEIAIEKYQALLTQPRADYTLRSIEQRLNLEARSLADKYKNKGTKEALSKIDNIIESINYLINQGKTVERLNILGSAYRRKMLILNKLTDRNTAIELAVQYYKEAYLLEKELNKEGSMYSFTNWLIGERFLIKKKSVVTKDLNKELQAIVEEKSIISYLSSQIKALQKHKKGDFWDIITNVNIYQCQLVYCKESEIGIIAKEIIATYKKAWKIDGSFRQKSSEIDQTKFMLECVLTFLKSNKVLAKECKKLLQFFEDLE